MATSTKTVEFQRVQVAAAGTSVALNPQPYDNTHTIIFYNRGTNPLLIGFGTAGGAIAAGAGADLPAGAALTWALGTVSSRPGEVATNIIIDAVGGAGDCSIQFVQSTQPTGPT